MSILKTRKMNQNKYIYALFLIVSLAFFSCQGLVEGINDDPNSIPTEDIEQPLFLTGAQLANISFQQGHLSRIAGLYSGQLFGFASVYSDVYRYNISTAESNSSWNKIYVGVVTNTRSMARNAPTDNLLIGISKVLEAHALGSAASVFGDVPFAEINNSDIDDPKFDSQLAVLSGVQQLLDEAITSLTGRSRPLPQDIHFGGDANKWIETANTLKARYYMITRDYQAAYNAAQKGISSAANNYEFVPRGTDATVDDKSQFWTTLNGARGGDIGSGQSYLTRLLDPSSDIYRGNDKTDETARSGYAYVVENDGASNKGIIEAFEPLAMASFAENTLTLAEAGARVAGFDTGLGHLNDYRAYLNTGDFLNSNFDTLPYTYAAYEASDFASGGIENQDGKDAVRALIREIIEERYVSGFLTWMPFDDNRRVRKSDPDVAVPFPLNDSSANGHVQRLPYPSTELLANANAPDNDPGIFTATEVNQ
jgi:hypothetical protein